MENLVYRCYIRGLNHKLYLAGVYKKNELIRIRILGTSYIIYNVEVNKKTEKLFCNCMCFYKNKYPCKHICFVLFKVFPIFRKWFKPKYPIQINRRFFPHTNKYCYTFIDCKLSNGTILLLERIIDENYSKYINPRLFQLDSMYIYYSDNYNKILKKFREKKERCIICFEEKENTFKCNVCNAYFDEKCIYKWLNINSTCPNCRSDLELLRFTLYAKKCTKLRLTKNQYHSINI